MDESAAYMAILNSATKHGITVEKAMSEIEFSISEAIRIAKAENNTHALKLWRMIPCKGEIPTAVEFVDYLGNIVSMLDLS